MGDTCRSAEVYVKRIILLCACKWVSEGARERTCKGMSGLEGKEVTGG